jgi:hypothetical protein
VEAHLDVEPSAVPRTQVEVRAMGHDDGGNDRQAEAEPFVVVAALPVEVLEGL